MFEVNYDRDGLPIVSDSQTSTADTLPTSPTVADEPLQESIQSQEAIQPEEAQQVPEEPSVKEKDQEGYQPKNFKVLREAKKRLDEQNALIMRERDEALRRLKELESRYTLNSASQEEQSPEINLGPDDLAEGKHLSAVERKIKKLEQQLESYQSRSQETIVETRLRTNFPDFDRVVSPDNIESLRLAYPELAETINSSSGDLYKKAVTAYTMIKNLGIHQEQEYNPDRERIAKNSVKPRSLSSVNPSSTSESPLARANAFADQPLTEEQKMKIYKETLAYSRMRS